MLAGRVVDLLFRRIEMIHKFRCQRCNGTKLSFERLTTVRADVVHDGIDQVEYGEYRIIDDDISRSPDCSYVCRDCNWRLHVGAYDVQLETDLQYYLSLSFDDIKEKNEAYFAALAEQQAECDAHYDSLI